MRLIPILTAFLVVAVLYLLIFERDLVLDFARGDGRIAATATGEDLPEASGTKTPEQGGISVVAMKSVAREIDSAVLLRGRTEAARQVEVRAETSGQVISEPLRKGSFVETGQLLCQLDPGTRADMLAEAEARLAEAKARQPEAEARVIEARARLSEAEINLNAASKLSEGGFASDTRVANANAGVESARAGLVSAQSGTASSVAMIQSAEAAVAAASREIARLQISAPFSGLLETDTAELGSLLQPGALCATIVQLDPIKLVGFVPEIDVDKIKVGVNAGARLATGRDVAGIVSYLSRSADPVTRTFRTEVEVPNPDFSIRDGQTAEILIASDGRLAHLIPQSALSLDDDGILGVRVVAEGDVARFVPVDLIRDSMQGVWVSGLEDNVDIIVVGQDYVADGVPLAVTYREPDA